MDFLLFPNLTTTTIVLQLTSSPHSIVRVLKFLLVSRQFALDPGCGDNMFQDTPYLLNCPWIYYQG
jgi:hypothetical protein